jgi:hypothetical protein
VIGWTAKRAGMPDVDYRIFSTGGTDIAGHRKLPAQVAEMGARPGWLGYIGVDDVDAVVSSIVAAGGKVQMPPMDMDGVGRMAMVADPQGVPFYVMRGSSNDASTSFAPMTPGRCTWNELSTPDQAGALAFYTGQFRWEKGGAMPMGALGDYQFINHGGGMIGAVMTNPPGRGRPAWKFAFAVEDIDTAAAKIASGGGTAEHAPLQVPTGDWVVNAIDPQGAPFIVSGPRK